MKIQPEELTATDIHDLLREHLTDMHKHSPPGSVYALDLEKLRVPSITFYTVRDYTVRESGRENGDLLGCGALKELNARTGEIKSMRTASAHLRKGVAAKLLAHILDEAKRRGYERVSLETGSTEPFQPAIRLYERFGFTPCGPFGDYEDTDFNLFMTIEL